MFNSITLHKVLPSLFIFEGDGKSFDGWVVTVVALSFTHVNSHIVSLEMVGIDVLRDEHNFEDSI